MIGALRRRPALERRVAGDAVLVLPPRRTVCVLNDTALAIWELCDGSRGAEEIVGELVRRFEVSEAAAREGCLRTVRDLQLAGLLEEVER